MRSLLVPERLQRGPAPTWFCR